PPFAAPAARRTTETWAPSGASRGPRIATRLGRAPGSLRSASLAPGSAHQAPEAIPAQPVIGAVPRPVDHQRLALDVRDGHGTPEARVVALVPVVTHHEDVVLRHRVGLEVVRVPGGPRPGRVRVVPRLAVDEHVAIAYLDGLALGGDDALDEVLGAILRPDEDDDVARLRLADPRQLPERYLRQRDLQAGSVDELVHQDVIADLERRQHGSRWNLEGLHDERADGQREQQRDAERLGVLAHLRLALRNRGGHPRRDVAAPCLELSHGGRS